MVNRKAQVINVFHSDNFRVTFSNFPKVFDRGDEYFDLRPWEYFVKNVTIPDSSLETQNIDFMNATQITPMSKANDNLPALSIEFTADEQLSNYYYMWSFVKKTRFGNLNVPSLRANVIKEISIDCLDNQHKIVSRIVFKNCLITSVGALNLESGTSNEITFGVNFSYEEAGFRAYQDGKEIFNDSEIEARQ